MISWELAIEPTLYFLFCSYLPLLSMEQRQEGAKIQGEMLGVGASRGARSDL